MRPTIVSVSGFSSDVGKTFIQLRRLAYLLIINCARFLPDLRRCGTIVVFEGSER
jgi:hypothetical protein